jgi:2-polyprenyl-3-methyl-5-hydroxy-6-metoxy-1,4-benzoquinol methylase
MFIIRNCITSPLLNVTPSDIDNIIYNEMREFIESNVKNTIDSLELENKIVVDIGLTGHVKDALINKNINFETIDIVSNNNPTYICDITKNNSKIINDDRFDVTICTEVLEHTNNPILAIEELKRITKKGGYIIISTPYNFRIHGPLYDNFRISEWYYKNIFTTNYDIQVMKALELTERKLCPISYFMVIKKNN